MPSATSQKRKLPFGGLQRRVRARREEPEPELEEYSDDDSQAEGDSEDGDSDDMSERGSEASDQSESGSGSEDEDEDEDDEDEDEDEDDPAALVAQVSFGALAKAQASMPNLKQKKGRRESTAKDDEDDDDNTISKKKKDDTTSNDNKSSKPKPPKRSSKHAPTEMTSKRQVSRKREVVSVHTVPSRDPRFSSATSHSSNPTDEVRLRKAYAFLDEYRDSEMSALRATIKKTRDAAEKEELTRKLKSMQSKREAQARKDAERELIEKHRRTEKELVAQGKKSKPFYLKKAEQKKQLLLDRFAGMKKRDVQKTIERRRKKLTSKEKKNMPFARRGAAVAE